MQFKVGDRVVHPTFGLGSIVKIEEREFSEKETRLYYQVTLPRSTLWIPVTAPDLSGLRLATVHSELDQYRHLLKSPPLPLHQNHVRRQVELTSRLKQGSFRAICEVVRDLTAWSWRKPLGAADTATLQKTRESLYQEWATAQGLSVREAIKEIEALLGTTRQAELSSQAGTR